MPGEPCLLGRACWLGPLTLLLPMDGYWLTGGWMVVLALTVAAGAAAGSAQALHEQVLVLVQQVLTCRRGGTGLATPSSSRLTSLPATTSVGYEPCPTTRTCGCLPC